MKCPKCSSRDIDFQEAGGQSICVNCGTVVEENTIVSSIEFQETGERSHVIGQYVSANCSKPFLSSSRLMGRHLDVRDSRDTTLFNARRTISQLASVLKLPQLYIDRAYRLYQLALQRNFIFGRRQTHVSASCLYIICRQEKSPHLLIDFSDALQINIYLLGKAFLHFLHVLNLNLPVVDPSLYIHRYASKLDFGDKMNSVVLSSLRIVTRLKKDWIAVGRRPDGVCAAALLISSRAHGFNISQENTSQLFNISMETLRKRLLEFRNTPSAQLNIEQLHINDLELEFDPPSYINGIGEESKETEDLTLTKDLPNELVQDDVFKSVSDEELISQSAINSEGISKESNNLKSRGCFSDDISKRFEAKNELYESISAEFPPDFLSTQSVMRLTKKPKREKKSVLSIALHKEERKILNDNDEILEGDIVPMSEMESLNYIFGEDERKKRAAVWEKTFGSFMEERARKKQLRDRSDENTEKYTQSGKLRRKYRKQGGKTTSEAVLTSSQARMKGVSKKINYEALKGVFAGDGAFAVPSIVEPPAAVVESARESERPKFIFTSKQSTTPTSAVRIGLEVKEDQDEEEDEELLYEGEDSYAYDDEYY